MLFIYYILNEFNHSLVEKEEIMTTYYDGSSVPVIKSGTLTFLY